MSSIQIRSELKTRIVEQILKLSENFDDFYVNGDCYGYICWGNPYKVIYLVDHGLLFFDMIGEPTSFFLPYTTIESRVCSVEDTINGVFKFLNVH